MKQKLHIAVLVLYTAFVTYCSLRPMDGISLASWDKVGHLVLYGAFAVLAYPVARQPRHYLTLCIAIFIYSGLMEVAQSFMPGRFMSLYDLLANLAGVVLGALFIWWLRSYNLQTKFAWLRP